MTANAGSVSKTFILRLNASILAVSVSATAVALGETPMSALVTQSVTLTSTGTMPATISGPTPTAPVSTLSGSALLPPLHHGRLAALSVALDSTTVGGPTGQLIIAINALTSNSTDLVDPSGTGTEDELGALAVTRTTISVTTGATQQFVASITGTSNTIVTWSVSGTGCRGITCGTISPTGIYAAPATAPSPTVVTVMATSIADPTKSASAMVTIMQHTGVTYYLAPASDGGNDSNNGLSRGAPWLTPNHSVECGDVILAMPNTMYLAKHFSGNWGTVICPSGNNVAWLKCAIFDGCKLRDLGAAQSGMAIGTSYWGVQGWEVDGSAISGPCFLVYPMGNTPVTLHHIVLANNIATGCGGGGIVFEPATLSKPTTAGTDYMAVVGNIDYNTAGGATYCAQGISIYEPIQQNALPGTHIYIAGNFAWGNFEASPCGGMKPTDGEGIILDTLNGCQTNLPAPYTQQIVVENNISVFNGARGIGVLGGCSGFTNSLAHIYIRHNTAYGNNGDNNQNVKGCGEITLVGTSYTEVSYNIGAAATTTGCGANLIFGVSILDSDNSDKIRDGIAFSPLNIQSTNSYHNGTFAFDSSLSKTTNPRFSDPVNPGPPNCSAYSSVRSCMATVIANFKPKNPAASAYGYQVPSYPTEFDALFPRWLCNVSLPVGLVSMECRTTP